MGTFGYPLLAKVWGRLESLTSGLGPIPESSQIGRDRFSEGGGLLSSLMGTHSWCYLWHRDVQAWQGAC